MREPAITWCLLIPSIDIVPHKYSSLSTWYYIMNKVKGVFLNVIDYFLILLLSIFLSSAIIRLSAAQCHITQNIFSLYLEYLV